MKRFRKHIKYSVLLAVPFQQNCASALVGDEREVGKAPLELLHAGMVEFLAEQIEQVLIGVLWRFNGLK